MGKMIAAVDYYFSKRPFMKNKPCADLGIIIENKDSLFFAIADVAGHGDNAYQLSLVIKKYFLKNHKKYLVDLMKGLHALLKGSRGAVALVGLLYKKTGAVKYVGIGNISIRKFSKSKSKSKSIISNEGIVGYIIPTPKIERLQLSTDKVLLIYTDGIYNHFELSQCAEDLFYKDAKRIAKGVIKHFYRGHDDAGCIAIRYKND